VPVARAGSAEKSGPAALGTGRPPLLEPAKKIFRQVLQTRRRPVSGGQGAVEAAPSPSEVVAMQSVNRMVLPSRRSIRALSSSSPGRAFIPRASPQRKTGLFIWAARDGGHRQVRSGGGDRGGVHGAAAGVWRLWNGRRRGPRSPLGLHVRRHAAARAARAPQGVRPGDGRRDRDPRDAPRRARRRLT